VPAEEVAPSETVLVRAGARVPVDGTVLSGRAAVDESAITGEPLAAEKAEGDRVYAGSTSQAGVLQVRAEGVGADTTVARIIRRVEEAQEERAPAQRLVERFARWYTPAAITLAAVVLAVTGDLERALTLLVIACPGALVMAAPVPVIAGIGRGARRGILIKGGRHLETAARISAVALDKTGTITRGQPSLTDVVALDDVPLPDGVQAATTWSEPEAAVLAWAAIAEAGSEHPLAKPIMAAAGTVPAASEGSTHPGRGITARHAGHEIAVGTPDLMRELQVPVSAHALGRLEEMQAAGRSTAIVALDGRAIGLLGITDELRPGSRKAVSALRALGLERLLMLSGDQPRAAETVAAQAGIDDVRARLLPEDKLTVIRSLQAQGHVVAMVGDGINDAPAIAAANVGVAVGAAGSGVALETSDIALLQGDLERLPEAISLARRTVSNIRQNVTLAVATVAILLAGVLAGEVHMAGGMLVHEASVLLVILNGMRLLRPEGATPWKY
jgi:Cd2+/Zn2+-exporting ATPase